MTEPHIKAILEKNDARNAKIFAPFNPITGEGSVGERVPLDIPDFPIPHQFIPCDMANVELVKRITEAGSITEFSKKLAQESIDEIGESDICDNCNDEEDGQRNNVGTEDRIHAQVVDQLVRLRCRYDFPFWAATFVYIKNKNISGDPEILFRLTFPQRLFVERLEKMRLAGKPIRLVLLKARQWGGSTTSQLYMAWLQLCHKKGLNSLIIAHQGTASDEIKDMFDRMIKAYPTDMLYPLGVAVSGNEPKMVGVGKSGATHRIPQRMCKIKIGTAERPDSCRGGDYALVHLSEVGLWKVTDGKKPADIVRSACGGVLYEPMTMIVYESTANGVGNFFHKEYSGAKNGETQFDSLFISWFEIDWNRKPFESEQEKIEFARNLYENRRSENVETDREEPGKYLWWLWHKGATLEGINWYVMERTKHTEHGSMASECPSDDVEAFVNSGAAVFDKYNVEKLKVHCRPPLHIGDVTAFGDEGEEALQGLKFIEDCQGCLSVWNHPDIDTANSNIYVANRYLTVVDVGGRSAKADWSVIVVFDRLYMLDNEPPAVVAQWYGHTDIDLLAWKAAQIASYYDDSLLVIESNTLETHDKQRQIEGGDQSQYILNQLAGVYPNLYARRQSEDDIRQGIPRKYGFHTNVATKPMIISTLIKCVREQLYIERDTRCISELLTYERKQNGAYGAIIGAHDDLLMTRAIGLHICFHDMELPSIVRRSEFTALRPHKAISAATL